MNHDMRTAASAAPKPRLRLSEAQERPQRPKTTPGTFRAGSSAQTETDRPQTAERRAGIAAESPIAPKTTHTTRKGSKGASRAAFGLTAVFLCVTSSPVAAQDHILRIDPSVDEVWRLNTRVRHTTVITLPASETILDFVVGDLDYWHLSGSANVAFLKPTEEGVETNVALVCESGRIYPFLVSESSETPPHLIVRLDDPEPEPAPAAGEAHRPAFVAVDQVASYQAMAQQAAADAAAQRRSADEEIAAARAGAVAEVDAFRADYPTRVRFPYRLQDKAKRWPFLVEGMWHDGQFTYLRSRAQESPALYERRDGQPSLVPYDLTEDGLYIVRRLIGAGWLQIGKQRAAWSFDEPEPLP